MIAVNLSNGRTIFLKIEDWLDMTHEQYQDLIANDAGYDIDNPFDKLLDRVKDNERSEWTIPDIPDEVDPNEPEA